MTNWYLRATAGNTLDANRLIDYLPYCLLRSSNFTEQDIPFQTIAVIDTLKLFLSFVLQLILGLDETKNNFTDIRLLTSCGPVY